MSESDSQFRLPSRMYFRLMEWIREHGPIIDHAPTFKDCSEMLAKLEAMVREDVAAESIIHFTRPESSHGKSLCCGAGATTTNIGEATCIVCVRMERDRTVAELEKDARRYRYLSAEISRGDVAPGYLPAFLHRVHGELEMDRLIDAAMAAKGSVPA